MLSGRYRSNYLCRHWSPQNRSGQCCSPVCNGDPETLEHIIGQCNEYTEVRKQLWDKWLISSVSYPQLQELIKTIMNTNPTEQTSFVLDPTAHPMIIAMTQAFGFPLLEHVLYLARTHCWLIHKKRLEMINNQ